MMSGKILGVGGAGLIQIAIWLVIGAIALAYRDEILGAVRRRAGRRRARCRRCRSPQIAVVLVYFVLGYLFYSAMYAAVGAMVSIEQDTQQAQMPVTMLLVIGVIVHPGGHQRPARARRRGHDAWCRCGRRC